MIHAGATLKKKNSVHLLIVALAALVLTVYWPAGGYDFVNLDDPDYVVENPMVLRGLTLEGVGWAFRTFHASNWHPLTWLSHMLDVELFGASPGWHHRVNVVLHLLNTELLFFVLWAMTGGLWRSVLVAALFGVHPLHVESVAWVAERKDVLSALFWVLTMWAYLRYARRPGAARYVAVVVLFALGLLCKPMLVTLPFVLLLLDFWPLGRTGAAAAGRIIPGRRFSAPALRGLLVEKVPLLALSALSCAVTYLAQSGGRSVLSFESLPLGSRVANAFVSYAAYLRMTVWPSALAVYYPHPFSVPSRVPGWETAAAVLLVVGLSLVVLLRGRGQPYLPVGWFWYLGTLVPVVGLVQVGGQALADRYSYLPLIGIFIAVAWAFPSTMPGRHFHRLAAAVLVGISLAAFATVSRVQAGRWRDSTTLLKHAVEVTGGNSFALQNLGASYHKLGQYQKAVDTFREVLRITPGSAEGWYSLGVSCNALEQYREAVGHFRNALRIKPDYAEAWYSLGASCNGLGRYREAVGHFETALRIKPGFPEAWQGLGVSYRGLGDQRQAFRCFEAALRVKPDNAGAWYALGVCSGDLGENGQAVGFYRNALRIKPDYAEAWYGLGMSHQRLGQDNLAISCYREALRLNPDLADARNNIAAYDRRRR